MFRNMWINNKYWSNKIQSTVEAEENVISFASIWNKLIRDNNEKLRVEIYLTFRLQQFYLFWTCCKCRCCPAWFCCPSRKPVLALATCQQTQHDPCDAFISSHSVVGYISSLFTNQTDTMFCVLHAYLFSLFLIYVCVIHQWKMKMMKMSRRDARSMRIHIRLYSSGLWKRDR